MDETADDMIEGLCCSECGVYFTEVHGYPVLCSGCHELGSATQKAIYEEA